MLSITLVIAFLSIGSVLLDSNLKEFCSKGYFHSFVANYQKGHTEHIGLKLNRKVDSNEDSYHSWDLLLDVRSKPFKLIGVSYKLEEGQTPKSSLTQPEECSIPMKTYTKSWDLKHFRIVNNDISGPKVDYNQTNVQKQRKNFGDPFAYPKNMITSLNRSGIWLSGIFCNVFYKTLYVIADETKSMNASNRTQVLHLLHINKTEYTAEPPSSLPGAEKLYIAKLAFHLGPPDKANEFFGINCKQIITNDEPWILTKTLFKLFLVLGFSAIILSVINLILVIRRKKNQIPDLSDDTSGQTVSTRKTAARLEAN